MPRRASNSVSSAQPWVPVARDVVTLRKAAEGCRGCALWRNATTVVFGSGNSRARWVLVGEQPGNEEDLQGTPFVGPAGKLLSRALDDARISRGDCYFTNAVKHFKWKPRGKRRIHQKPSGGEIAACRPWLLAELETIRPEAVICLGATAAATLLGSGVRVLKDRGRRFEAPDVGLVWVTVHPSMLLRMPDRAKAAEEYRRFVSDLKTAMSP